MELVIRFFCGALMLGATVFVFWFILRADTQDRHQRWLDEQIKKRYKQ